MQDNLSLELAKNYEKQKQIAIDSWNELQSIKSKIKQTYTPQIQKCGQRFNIALNWMARNQIEMKHVRSLTMALRIIGNDLANQCVNFPTTRQGLAKHLSEETKTLFYNNRSNAENDVASNIIEESSNSELGSLMDLDLFGDLNFDPRPFNVWNFQLDNMLGLEYPGQIPAGLVLSTLYFFTKPGDLIVDPMAGGGVVGDCCKEVKRRCIMYDINPIRADIIKNDITNGLPRQAENADLIFWDPPYWTKKEKEYEHPDVSISSLSMQQYMKTFENAAKDFFKKGIKKVAFLMSDHIYTEGAPNTFIWDYVDLFKKAGWKTTCHIHCPLSTEQVHNHQELIDKKEMWGISRSLVIFER